MSRRSVHRLLAVAAVLATSGCGWLRPDLAARVATGTTAQDLCSETFVSGLDPAQSFDENIRQRPGLSLIAGLLNYEIDREQREVRANLAGGFRSRAVYRGQEQGCAVVGASPVGGVGPSAKPRAASVPANPLPVADSRSPALEAAVDAAFAETAGAAPRFTKAVLVLHRGRIVAERYAPGYAADQPVLGFSMSKSITSALVGILVGDGKLQVHAPLVIGSHTDITLDHLMRMTSGLDLDETGSGFDPSNHVLYLHGDDMAAAASRARSLAPPGRRFGYSSASTHLVARQVRDAAGGAKAVQRFARERLFAPLGMQHVTMETDLTGTPVGGHYMLASPHDWARFGLLYLNDGVGPDSKRVLPPDWVRWSTQPTLGSNYGAGWWVNRHGPGPRPDTYVTPLMPDAPADTFYALGNLGQFVVVIPSRELVVVRLGRAHTPDVDIGGMDRLVGATLAALPR